MTMDERVKAAVEAFGVEGWAALGLGDIRLSPRADELASQYVREILAAAFPELSGDKPGWIAPWEPTDAMCHAVVAGTLEDDVTDAVRWDVGYEWRILRDAYLGEGNAG